jgi:hypothetical protein
MANPALETAMGAYRGPIDRYCLQQQVPGDEAFGEGLSGSSEIWVGQPAGSQDHA